MLVGEIFEVRSKLIVAARLMYARLRGATFPGTAS